MVVYLPSPLTQKPVLASFLKGGSEDTLSVSKSRGVLIVQDPLLFQISAANLSSRRGNPGPSKASQAAEKPGRGRIQAWSGQRKPSRREASLRLQTGSSAMGDLGGMLSAKL
jgi:hypothetical protein